MRVGGGLSRFTHSAHTPHTHTYTHLLCAQSQPTRSAASLPFITPHSEGTKVVDSAVLRFPKAVTHFSPGVRAWVHICQAICSEHSLFTHMPEYITLTPCLTLSSFWGYVPYCRATSIAPSRRPVSPTCFWRGTGSRVSPTVPTGSVRRGHTSRVGPLLFIHLQQGDDVQTPDPIPLLPVCSTPQPTCLPRLGLMIATWWSNHLHGPGLLLTGAAPLHRGGFPESTHIAPPSPLCLRSDGCQLGHQPHGLGPTGTGPVHRGGSFPESTHNALPPPTPQV